jgi:predicted DNA-binding transcriptional regulator YafY
MSNTATRLITLIMLLQRRPNQKAADLAAELGVSVRSLHRYMSMLDEMGIPIYSERGPHGGFSLVRGYKMAPMVFTPAEAVAVYLGTSLVGEMWGKLYADAACGALAKLENVLPNEQRDEVAWARRSLVTAGMHRGAVAELATRMEELRSALHEKRRVRIGYRGRYQTEAVQREIDPYALVYRRGLWYVVGYCHLRSAVRSFRVDRISLLEPANGDFEPLQGFDLQAFLDTDLRVPAGVRARLRFEPQCAHVALDDRELWETVELQPDGGVLVELAVPDMDWAASTVLAFGPIAEVLDPPELRDLVRARAEEIVKLHRSGRTLDSN